MSGCGGAPAGDGSESASGLKVGSVWVFKGVMVTGSRLLLDEDLFVTQQLCTISV
jgi:hypothetical protein